MKPFPLLRHNLLCHAALFCLFAASCAPQNKAKESNVQGQALFFDSLAGAYHTLAPEYAGNAAALALSQYVGDTLTGPLERFMESAAAVSRLLAGAQTAVLASQNTAGGPGAARQAQFWSYLAAGQALALEGAAASARAQTRLAAHPYLLNRQPVALYTLDSLLQQPYSEQAALDYWAVAQSPTSFEEGLKKVTALRGRAMDGTGYLGVLDYVSAGYGMSETACRDFNRQALAVLWPLYRELHTFARHQRAGHFKKTVPENLPVHWLPGLQGTAWDGLSGTRFFRMPKAAGHQPLLDSAVQEYLVAGFGLLPAGFQGDPARYALAPHYFDSHLDPALFFAHENGPPADVPYRAAAFPTVFKNVGMAYLQLSSLNPSLPPLLRNGSAKLNRLAAAELAWLLHRETKTQAAMPDSTLNERFLLEQALYYVPVLIHRLGTVTQFEDLLYHAPPGTARPARAWHRLSAAWEGVEMPQQGTAAALPGFAHKAGLFAPPFTAMQEAWAVLMAFQLRQQCSGQQGSATLMRRAGYTGALFPWQEATEDILLGEPLSASAVEAYFSVLVPYLKTLNEGKAHTLPPFVPYIGDRELY